MTEVTYKPSTKMQVTGGLQLLNYNQEIYEQKPDVPIVETVTPYIDVLYKFTRKKSLRTEVQYMKTDQDYGSWLFGLAEFGMAPNWIFEVSGMYNIVPKKYWATIQSQKKSCTHLLVPSTSKGPTATSLGTSNK
ncbi:MAG: hypothetical protein IPO65_07280 [Saprospiraceae bacterium]|nr:hypothetical protein [Saprospiraceae bacterium]